MENGGLKTSGANKTRDAGTPLVSIITVVYNNKEGIEQTILSVINQTYQNIEYIIIDGKSSDGTVDIIKKYEDKINYWISETDSGIYDAMNKGIDLASGEWVNFMNSGDTFYSNETIASLISYISSRKDVAVFYGDTEMRFNTGTKILKQSPVYKGRKNKVVLCHQSTLIRYNLLKENHYNTRYKIHADLDFFITMYDRGEIFYYIPMIIAKYDSTKGQSLSNPVHNEYEKLKITGFFDFKPNYLLFGAILVYRFIRSKIIKNILPLSILKVYRNNKSG